MIMAGTQLDGTYRRRARGQDVGVMALRRHVLPVRHGARGLGGQDRRGPAAVARLPVGLRRHTGWGSAVNTADVAPATPSW